MSFTYLKDYGVAPRQMELFQQYLKILLEWNKKINLTAITEPNEVEIKHYLDSLLLNRCSMWAEMARKEENCDFRVADVGGGAGFPGIPLRIVTERMRLDIIEATGKRVTFLQALTEALDLKEVRAFHLRAEEAGQNPAFREQYDWVLSRGVAALPVLLEYCLPLVKKGGYLAAYKGPAGEMEAETGKKAAVILGGKLMEIFKASLPGNQGERNILIYRKEKPSPAQYPRKPGLPAKQPLGGHRQILSSQTNNSSRS